MAQEKQNNVVLNFKTNGQVQYAKTLKQINMVMSTASKEYENHILAMGKDAKQTEKLAAEKKKLETQLTASAKKVEMLNKEFEEMQKDTNATADDLQKLYTQLLAAENAHTRLEQSMKRVGEGLTEEAIAAQDAKGELKQYVDEMKVLEAEQKKLSSAFDLQNASLSKNADEVEKAALKQRQYTQQVEQTKRYVDNLSKQLDAAKRAYGDNSKEVNQLEAKLNAARTMVAKFGQELEGIDDSTQEAKRGIHDLESAITGLAGVAAGVGLAKIFEESLNMSDLNNRIDIAFNVDESSKATVREMMADVQKYGVDVEEAFEGMRRQFALNGEAADEANGKVVAGAAAISKAYNRVDFVELIQEVNEIAGELEIADQEALDLVNTLLYIGFPDEQIDTIAEYGQQLKRAGYEAKEIKAIMASAVATDSWNIDVLLDGLKEGRVKAVEMGQGLSDGFKDAIAKVTNNTQKLTDEQLKQMEANYRKQEDAQKKSLDKQYKAAEKNYDNQRKALDRSLDAELKAFEKTSDKKIKLIDNEYKERLKLIDEEKYLKLKALDDEIERLEGVTDAENAAVKARENAEKRATLVSKVEDAKTKKNKELAVIELAKFDEQLQLEAAQSERKLQIESLKDQKDEVRDLYDDKKIQVQEEHEARKQAAQDSIIIEREAIRERQQLQKEAFDEQKAAYLENLREMHAAELENIQAVNEARMEAAKNPPDSALYTSTINQLEAWGKAIAAGGETGSKAYEDMAKWLDGIDDATLRNTIGTELYGTKWEDQGENIIDTILGVDDALINLENSTQDVDDMIKKVGEDNGLVKFQDAIQQTKVALDPLFSVMGDIIGAFATLAAEHPKITAFFAAIISFVGILAGAFAGLAPVIFTITSLFGTGAGGAGLAGGIGKAVQVITNLATKVLPLLGRAFSLLGGPIGWAIKILTIAVPIIIANWDTIAKFFPMLWEGIINGIKSFGDSAANFFKQWGPTIMEILKLGPIGLLVNFFKEKWSSIENVTKIAFNKVFELIKKPIDDAVELVKKGIELIKGFFNFQFKWPKIPMPKFAIKPEGWKVGDLFKGEIPTLDIKWHAQGGIMTRPTIFGASGNTLLGGGEAGNEAILPLNEKTLGEIGKAIAETINVNGKQGDIVLNFTAELDGAVIAKKTKRYMNRELFNDYQKDVRGRV